MRLRRVFVAERGGGFACGVLLEVVFEFMGLVVVSVVIHAEFEFSFFGAQHDRLALHASDHVEGRPRRAAQRHLKEIFGDAFFDRLAQFTLDFKIAVCRAESFDALMRAAVIVVFDPPPDALAGGLEALELRPH